MEQMYVVTTTDDHRFAGAAAFKYLTRKLPKLWFAAPLMHIPFSLPLWQRMYNFVANRRYKMGRIDDPCEGDTCAVHFEKKQS